MYPNNSFSRRRASGWAERRRYFKKWLDRYAGTSTRDDNAKKRPPEKEKE